MVITINQIWNPYNSDTFCRRWKVFKFISFTRVIIYTYI